MHENVITHLGSQWTGPIGCNFGKFRPAALELDVKIVLSCCSRQLSRDLEVLRHFGFLSRISFCDIQ
jgi:hypothetical protein